MQIPPTIGATKTQTAPPFVPEGVEIGFTKSGKGGINLGCQRAGKETARGCLLSPTGWIDTRANLIAGQDESRQYSAYLAGNHEVGPLSLPAPISVRPHA